MSESAPAMEQFRDFAHQQLVYVLTPFARLLMRLGITPNQVSVSGLVLNIVASGLIASGQLVWGGVVFLIAGALDLLDGLLARLSDTASRFGAFLDSTLDRISEGLVLAAIAYHFAIEGRPLDAGLVVLALLGSVLVSYARARAEGLGIRCQVGWMTRAERVVVLAAGLMLGLLPVAIYLLILLSAITFWQRMAHTARALAEKG